MMKKLFVLLFLIPLVLVSCKTAKIDYVNSSKIKNEMPLCDNINYIVQKIDDSKYPTIIGWYSGTDNYEQTVSGIVIKQNQNGKWITTLNMGKYDLHAEKMQYIGKIADNLFVFSVKNNYYKNDTSVRVLSYNGAFKVEKIIPSIEAQKAYIENETITFESEKQNEKYVYQGGVFVKNHKST